MLLTKSKNTKKGFAGDPTIMQKISQTSSPQGDVSGKYWSFRRRGGLSPDRDCSNPTVRRQISGSTTDLRPSGLRRQFQVDVSFFCFFCIFLVRSTRPRLFETNGQGTRARRRRTGHLLPPCGVSTRSRRSLRTRIERTKRPRAESFLRYQFQVSSQLTAAQTRGERERLRESS